MAEIILTNDNFKQEVLNSDKPVLVDFWATWCGPCMMIAPTVEEIADEYDGKIKVGKINVDEEPFLAEQFGIQYIPTLMVFKNGEMTQKSTGLLQKEQIIAMLEL